MVLRRVLRMKTTKQKNDYPIENFITLIPELGIVLLSYLSIPRNKSCSFSLLGHKRVYGYTLSAPSRLVGFLLCLIYRYKSQFDGVTDVTKLQVYVTVWRGLRYA